jgi:hypothetical protein
VESGYDALPERGGALLPGDGGGGAEQAAVLGRGEIPGDGLLLQLQPDLGRVEGDRGDLREGNSTRLRKIRKQNPWRINRIGGVILDWAVGRSDWRRDPAGERGEKQRVIPVPVPGTGRGRGRGRCEEEGARGLGFSSTSAKQAAMALAVKRPAKEMSTLEPWSGAMLRLTVDATNTTKQGKTRDSFGCRWKHCHTHAGRGREETIMEGPIKRRRGTSRNWLLFCLCLCCFSYYSVDFYLSSTYFYQIC